MNTEYFEKIGAAVSKINRGNTSYEKSMPYQSVPYINRITLDEQSRMFTEIENTGVTENPIEAECVEEIDELVGNQLNVWKKTFPKTARELFLNNKSQCTFYPLMIVYREVYGKEIAIDSLKNILWKFYKKLGDLTQVLKLWRFQGKREISDKVRDGKMTMEDAIMSDGFYLCNIDYWVICNELQLPVILFTSMKKLKHLMDNISWIELGKNEHIGKYWFIRAPTEPDGTSNVILNYSMITQGYTMDEIEKFKDKYDTAVNEKSNHLIELLDYLDGNFFS
jgi:hypothetical protein